MTFEEITIRVDPEVASAFKSASTEEQRKLEVLLNIRLQEAINSSDSLTTIMDSISQEAQERGLTPEILQSLLDE